MGATARASLTELHSLCWVALMSALVAAGALFHVSIGPVPITFQDFFVALSGLILGPRLGAYTIILYIFAGAVGLPVFSGGRGGIGHIAGPTGGFLAGFVLLALCCGYGTRLALRIQKKMENQRAIGLYPLISALLAALVGLGMLYSCGVLWLMYALDFSFEKALAAGVLPFIPVGPLKVVAAVLVWRVLYRLKLIPAGK